MFRGRWFCLRCSRWFVSSRTQALFSLPSLRSLSSWFFLSSDLSLHGHKMADVAPGDTFSSYPSRTEGTDTKAFPSRNCLLIQYVKVIQYTPLYVSWREVDMFLSLVNHWFQGLRFPYLAQTDQDSS